MPYSTHDKLLCIERELRMRRRVYPRAVTDRRMTAEEAEREIDVMEAIAQDYRQQLQPDLITRRNQAMDS
jgi:hypothetical protein